MGMRVRREIRTLSQNDIAAYFEAIRIMRSISLKAGFDKYGTRFRSYDYLSVKHATSVAHPCEDQGHLYTNQITFHRALLVEFELSVIAICKVIGGNSVSALPYWNWLIDVESNGDWVTSSLWKYWGSPYGDPEKDYCILDPVFNTVVSTISDAEQRDERMKLLHIISGRHFTNGFGYYRSPWNPSKCKGLARNPGWVLNAQSEIPIVHRGSYECFKVRNYSSFVHCTQGAGVNWNGVDFGPHNIPHIAMGTFDDTIYGEQLYFAIVLFVIPLFSIVLSSAVTLFKYIFIEAQTRKTLASQFVWNFLFLTMISISFVLIASSPSALAGLDNMHVYARWNKELLGRRTIDFQGTDWRNMKIDCPVSCPNDQSCPRCKLQSGWLGLSNEFSGSDFWDGAYSINENFFFSIHGIIDKMHYGWFIDHGDMDIEVSKCFNVSNTISPEFCFTSADMDLDINASSHLKSLSYGENPNLPCLTHEDIVDPRSQDYTYDVLVEDYSWYPVEPMAVLCPDVHTVCEQSRKGTPVSFTGNVYCKKNAFTLENAIIELNETLCIQSTNMSKPLPPVVVCDCEAELLRAKSSASREQINRHNYHVIGYFMAIFVVFVFIIKRRSKLNEYNAVNQSSNELIY